MMSKKEIRFNQAQELMLENAIGVMELAACLGVEEDKMEAMVGDAATKQIPDALARQMEQTFSKPSGWMDAGEDGGISFDLFGE